MNGRLKSRPEPGSVRKRYAGIAAFVVLAFAIVIGRLFQLQVINGSDYSEIAHENIIRRINLPTTRGIIRDSQGRVLASSRPAYNIYVVPGRVMPSARPARKAGRRALNRDDDSDSWPRIADVLRLSPAERTSFTTKLRDACVIDADTSPCWRTVLVREDAARDTVAEIRQHQADLSGVEIVGAPIRYYPYNNLASHLIGYVSEIDAETLGRFRPAGYDKLVQEQRQAVNPLGYELGDTIGATGIERAWETYLRGQRGWEKRVVDARGKYRTGPEAERQLDLPSRQEPIVGRDLRLTLDIALQQSIEKAMRQFPSGAVVVTEVNSGRVLASYSKPDYDPNDLAGGNGRIQLHEAFAETYSNPMKPMLDKVMSGSFQPGSTFKPFSALAALESGLVPPGNHQTCGQAIKFGDRLFRCTHAHGRVNMHEALAQSCNIYFYRLGETVGVDAIAKVAMDFGFGEKTGLAINPEAAGRVPTKAFYTQQYRGQFHLGLTLNTAIGQGATMVTPLQLALAYGALANGGTLYSPQVVTAVETNGVAVEQFPPRVRRRVTVKSEYLAQIDEALAAVVNDPKGTAYSVRDPSLEIAGKTGTAQTGYTPKAADDANMQVFYARDHAWFAAYSPIKDPEIAVVVLIEHGGSGPTQAAPVVMQIVREYQRLRGARVAAVDSARSPGRPGLLP